MKINIEIGLRKDKMPEIVCAAYQEYIDSEGKIVTTLKRCLVVSSWAKISRHAAAKKPSVEMIKIMDEKKRDD